MFVWDSVMIYDSHNLQQQSAEYEQQISLAQKRLKFLERGMKRAAMVGYMDDLGNCV